ncbi:MAG: Trk system potassium transporter TrkA [Halobacteriales archaeon]
MRILVIGAGEVGSSIASSLSESHEVVVVDLDAERVEQLNYSQDVLAVQGDGSSIAVLEEAEAGKADMVIASTDDDETNLVACSTAKVLSEAFTIARVRNTAFLDTWRRSKGVFGVDFMVCTNLLAAETIVQVAGLPAAHDAESFADGRVQMAEFDIDEGSPIAGQTVSEADRFEELTFAAVIEDGEVAIPRGGTVIPPGSRVVVIGTPESVRAFSENVSGGEDATDDIVVIGGDAIGEETTRLLADRGIDPTLIEADEDRARALAEEIPDAVVICHDATDAEFLEREHVDDADLVVVSLGSDERTLLASLLVKRLGATRAVGVVESGEYVDLFEAVGMDVAVNPREVVAEEITRFTRERETEKVAVIESDRAEVIEIQINGDSVLAGRPIREVTDDIPDGVVIGAITRDDEVITPRGETVIQPDDHVVLFADTAVLDGLMDRL